jgi:hypothetical protein
LKTFRTILIVMTASIFSCRQTDESIAKKDQSSTMKIIFLHHSTGQNIWDGGSSSNSDLFSRIIRKISRKLGVKNSRISYIQKLFIEYNKQHNKNYHIEDMQFPKESPYGWHNYPFDYYNIWVKNAGMQAYMEESTLEMLTKDYQIIVFKHCFPVSNIQPNKDTSHINSDYKSLANYKLQYMALREKLHQFPDSKFIVWTGAAQVKSQVTKEEAVRAKEFFSWVISEWDVPGDNIYLWDFYQLQTEGGFYFLDKYARSHVDSHPGNEFSKFAAGLFFKRLIDVIENNGLNTDIAGNSIF